MKRMTERRKEALGLFTDGYSYKEVANIMGILEGSACAHIATARDILEANGWNRSSLSRTANPRPKALGAFQKRPAPIPFELTERQAKVMDLLSSGLRRCEITRSLQIGPNAVDNAIAGAIDRIFNRAAKTRMSA